MHEHCRCRQQAPPSTSFLDNMVDLPCTNFLSPEFRTKFQRKVVPSVLSCCWLGGRKGIRPVKTEWWGAGMVICLERCADYLHMAQQMPLPLTVSCFSKIQIGFTFLVPAHPGSPGQRAIKWVCVFQRKVFLFLEVTKFPYNTVLYRWKEASTPKNQLDSSCGFDIIPVCNRRADIRQQHIPC